MKSLGRDKDVKLQSSRQNSDQDLQKLRASIITRYEREKKQIIEKEKHSPGIPKRYRIEPTKEDYAIKSVDDPTCDVMVFFS